MTTLLNREEQLLRLEHAVEHAIIGLANGNMDVHEAEIVVRAAEAFIDLVNVKENITVRRQKWSSRHE